MGNPQRAMHRPRELVDGSGRWPWVACRDDVDATVRLTYERVRTLLVQVEQQRLAGGLTKTQAAAMVGISPRAWRYLYAGDTWPDLRTFLLLDALAGPATTPGASPDPPTPAPSPGRIATAGQALARQLGHPYPRAVELLGINAPTDPDELEHALIDLACEQYLGDHDQWTMVNCARCEFAFRIEDEVCDRHGGWQPEGGWWPQLLGAWQYRVEVGHHGAKPGKVRAQRIAAAAADIRRHTSL